MHIVGSSCYVYAQSETLKNEQEAIKGCLLSYDGDDRYRICIKETNSIICSWLTFGEN